MARRTLAEAPAPPEGGLPTQPESGLPALPDQVATLWFLIRRLAGAMDRQGEALFRRELGVSLAQFLVLSVVDAHPGPLSQQAVADRLGLTKGTVSRQIDAAVAAGLMTVATAEHTRREHALALTEAGTALVRRGDALFGDSHASLQAAIDPQTLPATARQLEALLHAVEA
ncbi:MarR family winged helix-turn-helix transcriptional regulator [Nostocoides japonicum]|nr:MarR family winged helix-turn-helix transcriptional regulator [Tetrasphaera japonica]